MKTRPAEAGDAPAWTAMRQALWPGADASELAEETAAYFAGRGPLATVMLCEAEDGEPIGMIELSLRSHADGCRSSPVPFVEGWYVVPDARRQGVGAALMAAAEAWARAGGYSELASDTELENEAGSRAHAACGFEEIGRAIKFRKSLSR
ncbi:MAG TPA: GNAT family N-acetyltransferase [Dongiaceae bacterium]|nr:GNAT family N-acetyltransferase [Dongiaceae bacterium]